MHKISKSKLFVGLTSTRKVCKINEFYSPIFVYILLTISYTWFIRDSWKNERFIVLYSLTEHDNPEYSRTASMVKLLCYLRPRRYVFQKVIALPSKLRKKKQVKITIINNTVKDNNSKLSVFLMWSATSSDDAHSAEVLAKLWNVKHCTIRWRQYQFIRCFCCSFV